jgi:hypothetical protein
MIHQLAMLSIERTRYAGCDEVFTKCCYRHVLNGSSHGQPNTTKLVVDRLKVFNTNRCMAKKKPFPYSVITESTNYFRKE